MSIGQQIFGWVCLAVGLALVVTHIIRTKSTPAPVAGQESLKGIAEKLAEKAPLLGAGLAFAALGAAVLGFLDLQVAFGSASSQPPAAG